MFTLVLFCYGCSTPTPFEPFIPPAVVDAKCDSLGAAHLAKPNDDHLTAGYLEILFRKLEAAAFTRGENLWGFNVDELTDIRVVIDSVLDAAELHRMYSQEIYENKVRFFSEEFFIRHEEEDGKWADRCFDASQKLLSMNPRNELGLLGLFYCSFVPGYTINRDSVVGILASLQNLSGETQSLLGATTPSSRSRISFLRFRPELRYKPSENLFDFIPFVFEKTPFISKFFSSPFAISLWPFDRKQGMQGRFFLRPSIDKYLQLFAEFPQHRESAETAFELLAMAGEYEKAMAVYKRFNNNNPALRSWWNNYLDKIPAQYSWSDPFFFVDSISSITHASPKQIIRTIDSVRTMNHFDDSFRIQEKLRSMARLISDQQDDSSLMSEFTSLILKYSQPIFLVLHKNGYFFVN